VARRLEHCSEAASAAAQLKTDLLDRHGMDMTRWMGRIAVYLVAVWLAVALFGALGRFDPEPEVTTAMGTVLVFVLSMLLQIGFLISPEAVHRGRRIRQFCVIAMLPIWVVLAFVTIGAVGEALTEQASRWLPLLPAVVGFGSYTICSLLMILPGVKRGVAGNAV
jgi:hypothetical protein